MSVIVQRADLLGYFFLGYLWHRLYFVFQKKNGGSQMLDQDRNEKYSKGDFKSEIFDFWKKCDFLKSVGSVHIKPIYRWLVPRIKFHSFFFKMVYHLLNGDLWLFFYSFFKNLKIKNSPCKFDQQSSIQTNA